MPSEEEEKSLRSRINEEGGIMNYDVCIFAVSVSVSGEGDNVERLMLNG